jgi:hypothetical protein
VKRAGVGGTSAALLFVALVIVLFVFDPTDSWFYPPCLFKTIFGAQCPGCGSLRAMHQLLHGNVAAAWALNKPIVFGLPLAAVAGAINIYVRRTRSSRG